MSEFARAARKSRIDPSNGAAFHDVDAARCYLHRPPYPAELYEFILAITPGRLRALDLGCGPGKIALELAPYFANVDAIDPSLPMIELASSLHSGDHPNINWVRASAEEAPLDGAYDLITAGASIHWMRHEVLFPKIARHLEPRGIVAVIDGDGAFDPPWSREWREFMTRWLAMSGATYDERAFDAELRAFEQWMNVSGRRSFVFEFEQSIESFIACQHSRATWTRAKMGHDRANTFDHELRELLLSYARDARLRYRVKSRLTWGTPRLSAEE